MKKKLGKIETAQFGLGGYQDAQMSLDLTFSLEGGSSGVGTSVGPFWADAPSEYADWTHVEQTKFFARLVEEVRDILQAAKVKHVSQLIGCPVECTFDRTTLIKWRVLEEVL